MDLEVLKSVSFASLAEVICIESHWETPPTGNDVSIDKEDNVGIRYPATSCADTEDIEDLMCALIRLITNPNLVSKSLIALQY